MTARRLPASTRPTTHCSATFSPSSISLEFHIPDDWICEKDEAVEHQEGMAEILRHTKKAPATKEVLLSFPPSPEVDFRWPCFPFSFKIHFAEANGG
ncbi:hypothetical protein DAI22_02g130400 [Oryza sativa Japonica Group]|nr:hypothetical protein DAI22_02g130400 [Oryza sativa Japonica Group]